MPAELCAAARDRLWASNLTRKLRRHDPSSWRAPFPDDDTSRDGNNFFFNRRWQVRSVGGEQVLMDMLPNACAAMAAQLLGEDGFIDPRDARSATKDGADRARQTNIDGEAVGPAWARCRGIYCGRGACCAIASQISCSARPSGSQTARSEGNSMHTAHSM